MKTQRLAWLALLSLVLAAVGTGCSKAEAVPFHAFSEGVTKSLLGAAVGSKTTEVLVLNSAATVLTNTTGSVKGRASIEVFNNGPNTIWCAFTSSTAVITKSRPVFTNSSWAIDAPSHQDIYCKAASADQVTGAATVVSELLLD